MRSFHRLVNASNRTTDDHCPFLILLGVKTNLATSNLTLASLVMESDPSIDLEIREELGATGPTSCLNPLFGIWKPSGMKYIGVVSHKAYWNLDWALVDIFSLIVVGFHSKMSNSYTENHDVATVVGFEVPKSPDSSYNNGYPGNEDVARDPPMVPPHLQHSLVGYPANIDTSETLPLPQNVILNHLYIENREPPRSVVALGFTHRFRSKYVTVVLYKPVRRRGSTSI
ncbi:hypothetical protein VNO77_28860 [Canavalia gladiata]|uniref:Association with the SNF1 complex (ASC) domain-containing protein n=1 Tax=Canavalia gladiata TaxID=3824 RepID=A0AAN9KX56_CANGL